MSSERSLGQPAAKTGYLPHFVFSYRPNPRRRSFTRPSPSGREVRLRASNLSAHADDQQGKKDSKMHLLIRWSMLRTFKLVVIEEPSLISLWILSFCPELLNIFFSLCTG
jgi:hypothetical protein